MIKFITVAMLSLIIGLTMYSVANAGKQDPEFVCKSDSTRFIVGQPIEKFDVTGAILLDSANFYENPEKFKNYAKAIIGLFNAKPPYPVDEIRFYDLEDETLREQSQFFLAVFVYNDCLMNVSKIPDNKKSTIFGTDL